MLKEGVVFFFELLKSINREQLGMYKKVRQEIGANGS